MRLHHVGIEVKDLYRVELFYRKVLGFSLRYRYVSRNTAGLRTVFLERDGVQLELLERPRDDDFQARRAYAPDHLSLEVADVDAEHARLAGLGFPGAVVQPPRNTGDGFRELTLRDPEGQRDRDLHPGRARAALSRPGRALRPRRDAHRQRAQLLLRGPGPPGPARRPVHRGGQAEVHRVRQPRPDERHAASVRPDRRSRGHGGREERALPRGCAKEHPPLPGDEALLGPGSAARACRWRSPRAPRPR